MPPAREERDLTLGELNAGVQFQTGHRYLVVLSRKAKSARAETGETGPEEEEEPAPEEEEESAPEEEEKSPSEPEEGAASEEDAAAEESEEDAPGYLDFTLCSGEGLEPLRGCRFHLEGPDVDVSDKTDGEGHFRHGPVEMGEYDLTVGDATFSIPSIADGTLPHMVCVPSVSLPEARTGWTGPDPEETDEMQPA